jgi:hypothetical protein
MQILYSDLPDRRNSPRPQCIQAVFANIFPGPGMHLRIVIPDAGLKEKPPSSIMVCLHVSDTVAESAYDFMIELHTKSFWFPILCIQQIQPLATHLRHNYITFQENRSQI